MRITLEDMMEAVKIPLVIVCSTLVLLGIVHNVTMSLFSTPRFDVAAWSAIGIACLVLVIIGRSKPK